MEPPHCEANIATTPRAPIASRPVARFPMTTSLAARRLALLHIPNRSTARSRAESTHRHRPSMRLPGPKARRSSMRPRRPAWSPNLHSQTTPPRPAPRARRRRGRRRGTSGPRSAWRCLGAWRVPGATSRNPGAPLCQPCAHPGFLVLAIAPEPKRRRRSSITRARSAEHRPPRGPLPPSCNRTRTTTAQGHCRCHRSRSIPAPESVTGPPLLEPPSTSPIEMSMQW